LEEGKVFKSLISLVEVEVGAGDGNRTHVAIFKAESLKNGLNMGVLNRLDRFECCRLLL
jgi:hypothetical protein